jgi:hypothetical protein
MSAQHHYISKFHLNQFLDPDSLRTGGESSQGLKPTLILNALRGAKAPLFHGATYSREFFSKL